MVDGVRGVVWVTWHADGVVGGRARRSRRRLGDVARERRCGWWWTASATSTGDFGCDRNGAREVGARSAFVRTVRGGTVCLPDVSDGLGRMWSGRERLSNKFDAAIQIEAELEIPDGRTESGIHGPGEPRALFLF